MKKIIFILTATVMVAVFGTITVFAQCHGRGRTQTRIQTARYTICDVESCISTKVHTHNRISYSAHYYGDGHDYHDYCTIEDCILTEYHEHDGEYCFGRTLYGGYSHCGLR